MRTDISALIGSRICHDLISPIGAIGNGVELLSLGEGPANGSPELELISESVENASARIKFFRIAYGSNASHQIIGRQEVLSTLAATARGGRLTYFWNISDDQPRDEVRAVFLGLQCFETALPLGGTIDINRSEGIWEIQGTGRRLALDASLWDSLANPRLKTDFTPAEVQFALLPTALHEARRKIEIRRADDTLIMRF